jgi:hypothetical protein
MVEVAAAAEAAGVAAAAEAAGVAAAAAAVIIITDVKSG